MIKLNLKFIQHISGDDSAAWIELEIEGMSCTFTIEEDNNERPLSLFADFKNGQWSGAYQESEMEFYNSLESEEKEEVL